MGRETRWTFDERGRQLTRTLPLGFGPDGIFGTGDDATLPEGDFTESFEYDARGRQTLHVSFEGVVTQSIYDDAKGGRLKEMRFFVNQTQYDQGLDPADISFDGNVFTASVPLGVFLPASTRPPSEWTYNLWPRNGIGQNVQVSDLAPDDGNSPVRTLPPESPSATSSLQGVVLDSEANVSTFDTLLPAGFTGLSIAVERFSPSPPPIVPNPIQVSPVFLLNFGGTVDDGAIPQGLNVAVNAYPVDPNRPVTVSPVFIGLTDGGGPVVDTRLDDGSPEWLDTLWNDPAEWDELLV